MTTSVSTWFKEMVKDRVTIDLQAHGGLLDNTMMAGDVQANTVKFPIASGQSTVYKLTGGIEAVPVNDPGLSTVTLTMEDFEAVEWWRTQDAYKAGASEKDTLLQLITKAVRRKRDNIKFGPTGAVQAFYDANSGSISTVGTGAEVPAPAHFETAIALLEQYGDDGEDGDVFCPVPSLWLAQLEMYSLWNNTQYGAGMSDVFNKTQRSRMKKVRGITFIKCPDSYFRIPAGGQWETFMWRKGAFGAETPFNKENADVFPQPQMQGTPWLAKASISGAAVGLLTKGVRRLLLSKPAAVVAV